MIAVDSLGNQDQLIARHENYLPIHSPERGQLLLDFEVLRLGPAATPQEFPF